MARQTGTARRGSKSTQTAPEDGVDGAIPSDAPVASEAVPAAPEPMTPDAAASAQPEPAAQAEQAAPVETPPDAAPSAAASPEAQPAPRAQPRGGLVPMVLGGVLAAGIGAGAVLYLLPQGLNPVDHGERLDALEARLTASLARIEGLIPADTAPALRAMEARLDSLGQTPDPGARLEALEARLGRLEPADLQAGIDAAVSATIAAQVGPAAEAAIAAALGETLSAQEDRAARISQAEAELLLNQTRIERRAALAELTAAAQSGAPAPQVLTRLAATGADVSGLWALESGIATQAALLADFAPAARAALAAAPLPEDAAPLDRVTGFLRGVTNARSLAPREGADTDAILSRAEAHLRAGDLDAALGEIAALPEGPAAAIAPWQARALARNQTLAALAALMAED